MYLGFRDEDDEDEGSHILHDDGGLMVLSVAPGDDGRDEIEDAR